MSAPNGIPEDVYRFLLDHVGSVEQIEILLLTRAHRERNWSAEDVARELRTAALSAVGRLADLETRGLLARDGDRYRFAPSTPTLEATVEGLAKVYAERRVTVIEIIFSKPSDVIRTFADAFRLRRER